MKVLLFAIAFALLGVGIAFAGTTVRVPLSVPTMMPWGMVATAAAMGLTGLYFIFKRK